MSSVPQGAEQYLADLLPDLNLRLFCDMQTEDGHFPQSILWVEKITMLKMEAGASSHECEEKDCQEEGGRYEEKEPVFSGRIKYIAEKIKRFMTLWKKKGR